MGVSLEILANVKKWGCNNCGALDTFLGNDGHNKGTWVVCPNCDRKCWRNIKQSNSDGWFRNMTQQKTGVKEFPEPAIRTYLPPGSR